MPARCDGCRRWVRKRRRLYEDGTQTIHFEVAGENGLCELLACETKPDFGCNGFEIAAPGYDGVVTEMVAGLPWQKFRMDKCPDCDGRGSHVEGGECRRCAGIGKVRHYDDGYIGEERTRKHPVELEREQLAAAAERRARAQAILDGVDFPEAPVVDGTVLQPLPKPSVL